MRHCGRSIWWNCYASPHVRSDIKDYYSAPGFGSRLVTEISRKAPRTAAPCATGAPDQRQVSLVGSISMASSVLVAPLAHLYSILQLFT